MAKCNLERIAPYDAMFWCCLAEFYHAFWNSTILIIAPCRVIWNFYLVQSTEHIPEHHCFAQQNFTMHFYIQPNWSIAPCYAICLESLCGKCKVGKYSLKKHHGWTDKVGSRDLLDPKNKKKIAKGASKSWRNDND